MDRRDDALLRAQAALTDRDLVLLGWLYDHRLLTTPQIATALFPSLDVTQRRLKLLIELRVVDRFRPQRAVGGTFPYHYVLAQLGYEVVAGQRQVDLPRRDRARLVRAHLTSRANLPHRLGTNQIFVDLAGHARTHPGTELEWPSADEYQKPSGFVHSDRDLRSVALETGVPRPDGWGHWHEHGQCASFLLELDLGTEAVARILMAKVAGYEMVARDYTRWRWPVLFVLPTLRRERNLHTELNTYVIQHAVIATTARELLDTTGRSPAEAVWRLHGHDGPRLPLIRLPCTDDASTGFDPTTPTTGPAPADLGKTHRGGRPSRGREAA